MNKIENEINQLRFEVDEFFRELPKVLIGKKKYYRDDDLQEFRNVVNPNDRITFEEYAIIELARRLLYRACL